MMFQQITDGMSWTDEDGFSRPVLVERLDVTLGLSYRSDDTVHIGGLRAEPLVVVSDNEIVARCSTVDQRQELAEQILRRILPGPAGEFRWSNLSDCSFSVTYRPPAAVSEESTLMK